MGQLYYGNGIARGISQAAGAIAGGMQQRALLVWQAEQKRLAREAELQDYERKISREDRLLAEKKIGLTQGLESRKLALGGGIGPGVGTLGQFQQGMPTDAYAAEGYMTGGTPDLPTQEQNLERETKEEERLLGRASAWLLAGDDPKRPGFQITPERMTEFKAVFPSLPPGFYEQALQAANKAQSELEATGRQYQPRSPTPSRPPTPPKPPTITESTPFQFGNDFYTEKDLRAEIARRQRIIDEMESNGDLGGDTETQHLTRMDMHHYLDEAKERYQDLLAQKDRALKGGGREPGNEGEIEELPAGAVLVGQKDGADIYQTPDGNQYKVEP